jgi:hypothetical protein
VIVRKVDGRIYLKLVVEAPRKPNRKEVFLSALIIDLETPVLIVVVSVTEHRFRATMNDQASSDKLMVFCYNSRLREGVGALLPELTS